MPIRSIRASRGVIGGRRGAVAAAVTLVAGCGAADGPAAVDPLYTEEVLRIGVVEGPEELQFNRITAARFLDDGSVLVGNAGTGEVRRFRRDGAWMGSFGALGQGPGEHRSITGIWASGDTVWVVDNVSHRLTTWLADGRHLSTRRIPMAGPEGRGWVHGRTGDGRFVVAGVVYGVPDRDGNRPDSVDLFLWDEDADWAEELVGRYFFHMLHMYQEVLGFTWYPAPLRSAGRVAASGGDVWILEGNEGYLERVTAEGRDRMELAMSQRVPVSGEHRQLYEEEWVGSVPEQARPRLRNALQAMTFPDHLPIASNLMVGGDGSVWVQRFSIGPQEAETWWRIPPGDADRDHVIFPRPFTPMDALGDLVVGVDRDDMDVQYVVVRRIRGS